MNIKNSITNNLTVAAQGHLYLSPSGSGTVNTRTAANITLNGGTGFSDAAELNFNFNAGSVDNLSTTGTCSIVSGCYYRLNPNIISAVPPGTYAIVSGNSFSGAFEAGKWQIVGTPVGWFLQQSGNALNLVVADPTTKWMASANDGNWNTTGNWVGGTVPNGEGKGAEFDDGSVAGSGAVNLDVAVALGTLKFSSASNSYNLSTASNPLTFQNDTSSAPSLIVAGNQEISGAQGIQIASGNTLATSDAGNLTISAPIHGTGNLNIGGTVTLSNAVNDFSGTTVISGGTTTVTGGLTSTSSVTVNITATLSGTGTIGSSVTVASGGTVNPGTVGSVGTLSVASVAFQNGSTFAVDVDSGLNNADKLAIAGTATIAAGAKIKFNVIGTAIQGKVVLATATGGLDSAFTVDGALPPNYKLWCFRV